jgi:hypothetical protein
MPRERILCLVLACATVLAPASYTYAEDSSCTIYQSFFDAVHAENKGWMNNLAADGRGATYYNFSYVLGGTLAMFEGTNDLKYLDQMFRWADAMIDAASIVDDHGKKNWSGEWSSPWTDAPIAYLLEDLQGSTELARLARITLTDSRLRSAYGSRAQATYRFVKDHIVDKWLTTRRAEWWFRTAARDQSTAYSDKIAMLVRLLLDLYQIDGNATYASLASDLLAAFKQRLVPHANSSLAWDLALPGKAPDTSHANRMPYMIVDAYAAGIEVTSPEIRGLSNLLTGVIWDRSTASPQLRNYIDGDNSSYSTRPAWANGQIASGWITLGAYDVQVQQVAKAVLSAIVAGVRNPSLEYMRSIHGKVALAGYITRNMRVANTCF